MLNAVKDKIVIGLDEQTGALFVSCEGGKYEYKTEKMQDGYTVSNARVENDKILFDVSRPEEKEGEIQLGEAVPDKITLVHAVFEVENELFPCAKLTLSSNARFEKRFTYPPAFEPQKDDTLIVPQQEGLAIPAYGKNILAYHDYNLYGCGFNTIPIWALMRGGRNNAYVMTAVETNYDAGIKIDFDDDKFYRVRPYFESSVRYWSYDRVLRFVVSDEGGLTDMCLKYRKLAEKRGFVRTLKEKAQAVKNVDKMIGAADVWVFNNDAMYKLYNKDAELKVPSADQLSERCRIADDMKKRNIDRVLWSIFDENLDKNTIAYVKKKGYLTTVYDVFADVIPRTIASNMTATRYNRCKPRLSYWPDGIAVEKDGSLMKAWELMGRDGNYYFQNRMCDKVSVDCAKERIPKLNKKMKLDGWFLDVVFGKAHECYSKEHPTTRQSSLEYKRQLTKLVEDLGLVCGTEVGREDGVPYVVYNEGMLSLSEFRANQSGRRMASIYKSEDEPSLENVMLNETMRIPLWELIYHDCMISYWYWGDSQNCCVELMDKRDLFLNLYGLPPIFSFSAENYDMLADKIEKSYKNTSPLAKEVGYERMMSFEYLSDDLKVQKTTFSNGVEVIVNFSDNDFHLDDNSVVKANDRLVIKK